MSTSNRPDKSDDDDDASGQHPSDSDSLAADVPISYVAPVVPHRWQPACPTPGRFGDYELLNEIGHGGMGVTYRARQVPLNRIVALKLIKSGQLASPQEVLRFRAEAEAAASLDHPHIVPVFEVGQAEGQHFFSMAYVEGWSLEERLRDGPLAPPVAARLLADMADAIHYAHGRGIVHRDLKPANILLARDLRAPSTVIDSLPALLPARRAGPGGAPSEALVPKITDFGLAKRLESGEDLTITGQVLGTPGFMPPEQVDTRRGAVGPAADIYALGAILYNMITGRPPFQAAGVHETLAQVLDCEPVAPRQLNATVDRDLETICLKCLDKDPSRRYATAQDLADELRRFLDQRPIVARPIGSLARLGRWCRRRPALAASIAALVGTLLGGTLVSSYYAYQAHQSAQFYQQEKVRADEETDRAHAALARETEALGKLTRSLAETQQTIYTWVETTRNTALLREPRFKPVLKELLGQAQTHYERFVREHGDDQSSVMRQQLARAFFEIGWIHTESGSMPLAIDAYQKAAALYERLAQETPQYPIPLWGLAKCQTNRGMLLSKTGQLDEAELAYRSAQEVLEQLVHAYPQDSAYARDLAICCENLGLLYSDSGRPREGLHAAQRAREIRTQLAAQDPQDPDAAGALAMSLHNLGRSCIDTGDTVDAFAHFQDAQDMFTRLVRDYPDRTDFQCGLSRVHHSLGVLFSHTGELDKAVSCVREQQRILRQLTAQYPTVTRYEYDLAMSHDTLGTMLATRGRLPDALEASAESCRLLEALVTDNAAVARYAIDLAGAHFNRGNIEADAGNADAAVAAYGKALEIQQRLASEQPAVTQYQSDVANTLNSLGIVYSQTGRLAEAADAYDQALPIQESLLQANPQVAALAIHLGGTYVNRAILQRPVDPEAALASLTRAVAVLEPWCQREPDLVLCRVYLRNAYWTRAETLGQVHRHQQAAEDWQRARALDRGPDRWQCAAHQSLSLALAGEFRPAAAAALEAIRDLLMAVRPDFGMHDCD